MPAIGNLIHTFRTPSLPSVLVSRFLLDLQEAHQRKVVVLASHRPLDSTGSSPSRGDDYPRLTPPALSALGATIDPADWALPDDALEDVDEEAKATFVASPGRIHPAGEEFKQGSPPKHRDKHKASSDVRQPSGPLSTARAHVVDDLAKWRAI